MGLPLPLLNLRRRLAGGISPAALFLNSEPGVWYDPSDLTTMFQDRAGTTLVTAPGQTVGLVLDKSRGLVLGPELVTNGTFDTDISGWVVGGSAVVAWNGGAMDVTRVSSAIDRAYQALSTTIGMTYVVSFTASGLNPNLRMSSSTAFLAGNVLQDVGPGTYYFVATNTTMYAGFSSATSGGTATFDNISVREIPGNHMVATADASRGTYGIEPFGGRRNLLTFTEQFENAAWVKSGLGVALAPTVTANFAPSPLGDVSAERVQFSLNGGTTSTDQSFLRQTISGLSTVDNFAFSFYARATDGVSSYTMIAFGKPSASESITVTGQWQRFVVSGAGTNTNFSLALRGGQTPTNSNTADLLIWGAQLELGSTATNYQRVGSAFDVTEAGVPTVHYVQFDGADDGYLTSTITPGTDKVQVFAGVRKLSDVAGGTVAELSANYGNNSGTLGLFAPVSSTNDYRFASGGTVRLTGDINTGFDAPITNVLTGIGDIPSDVLQLRVNGTQVAQNTGDQGTGNYLAYPLYIGRRGGTTLPFNGRLYQLAVRFGPNLDTARIQQVERYMAQKTGVTL